MSVTYVIGFRVRSGQLNRFRALIGGVLEAMRHEPNFRNAALHVSPEDPLRFLLYETWADHQDVLEVQLNRPYRAAWHAALPELLEAPREISVWRPLWADMGEAHRVTADPGAAGPAAAQDTSA